MKNIIGKGLALAGVAVFGLASFPVASFAEDMSADTMPTIYRANLAPLNHSGAYGVAYVVVDGDQATVTTDTYGLSAGLPHAQHIHLGDKPGSCPTLAVDANHDGLISVAEAANNYGPIKASLTTTGDTSADSALAVDRFPVGGTDGKTMYSRTFTLPAGVTAASLANGEIVQHGISTLFDDPTMYDGSPRSSIAPTLPLEATIPADCGTLQNITPQVIAAAQNGEDFDMALGKAVTMLDSSTGSDYGFADAYIGASTQLYQKLSDAMEQYIETAAMSGKDVARDQYVDTYNNAKAMYLNQLEMARNKVVDTLSGTNDVAKDQFVNSYNMARDMFNNQLETIKNEEL